MLDVHVWKDNGASSFRPAACKSCPCAHYASSSPQPPECPVKRGQDHTGFKWNAALPTQSAKTARCRSRPIRASIWLWRYKRRRSTYLLTSTWAKHAGERCLSRHIAHDLRWLGHKTFFTPSVLVLQAYFGRTITMTGNGTWTMSNRSLRSSPILCMMPQSQEQIRLAGSMTSSMHERHGQVGDGELRRRLVCPVHRFAIRISFSASMETNSAPATVYGS